MNTVVILLCAGSGNRMRGAVIDKILVDLNGRPVFDHSVSAFEQIQDVSAYMIVFRDEPQKTQLETRINTLTKKPVHWIRGGKERQDSVYNALKAIPKGNDFVMIHDCARPLIQPDALREVEQAMIKDKAACLAHRMVDTVKQIPENSKTLRQIDLTDLDRHRLWAMETPQAFGLKLILGAYSKLAEDGIQVTDDTAAVVHYGYKVTLVENSYPNPKITLPEDLALAELMLQQWDKKA